ncbi:Bacterial type II secretion system protein F domain protein [Anatilimnocola aggregata]|uniref:Bacterial type II secretion system protein F domain protein n=1 Tax=Anatilimnocola aggregata TaxID=2528021 RepID=A0A517YLC9_9BACT|nr:type II secretion system F family protein [Anatilimnocola aggregata]QDU31035.1 Bacterial type II secretion system protein F domain protein [Anatilimnocola aggregata]
MTAQLAIVTITFASVSTALAALGFFLRDLFAKPQTSRARLEFQAEEPEGGIDGWFFRLVEQSGVAIDATSAMLIVVGCGIAGLGIPLVLFENFLGAAGGMILGVTLGLLYFAVLRFFRLRTMQKHLPTALQAVSDSIRSGQTLSEACDMVSKEIKGPLGAEFGYAHEQLELSHSPVSVMTRMARRIPLPEFRIFTTAVVVHRRAGGNLSLLSERMSKAARDRQEVRSHLMAVTAGGRLSAIGMVVCTIVALIALSWMDRGYVDRFLSNPKGPWLLATAVGLQIVGAIWVWRILRTSY